MTETDKTLIEKVDEITKVNFTVNECPLSLLKEFKEYANEHTRNNYPLAIEKLLSIAKTNAKDMMIWENILELKDRISKLESEGPKQPERPRIPTIGKTKKRENKNEQT